nr:E3 ubiquitin-protein ligase TRIM7-like isoform X2 [Chrysemys picta bellii]
MAVTNPEQLLLGEVTCAVCLDYFKDPVSLDCGHHFCQACITRCWEALSTNLHCPECRETFSQRNFKPNRQLRNIVEASRKLTLEPTKEPEVGRVCEKHKEDLIVFCQEDQTPICLVCHLSRDHREHTAVPIEEAAEDYKKQLETEKQKVVSEFQQLRQFLEKQERLRLAQLEELNKEIEKGRAEYVAKLSEEISSFSSLISEMEQKCQQPASEFLQDIKGTLSRCERKKFQNPVAFSSELKSRIWESSQRNASLEPIMKKFKDSLSSAQHLNKANVTLDPDTANHRLTVSADRRSMRWGETEKDLPENPERFDADFCVMGCEGFTSGRHTWEVEVEGWGFCFVGVARESVSRKGEISFNPEQGIWAVSCSEDQYWALTSPEQRIPLSPSRAPPRIQVHLDYEQGKVAFFDAGTGDPIFTFPPASFAGERIRPFFCVVGVSMRLTLCP